MFILNIHYLIQIALCKGYMRITRDSEQVKKVQCQGEMF